MSTQIGHPATSQGSAPADTITNLPTTLSNLSAQAIRDMDLQAVETLLRFEARAKSELAMRMRKAGHELASSVQPKGSPQLRKEFLLKLPKLMKDLNEGLALIQWPDEAKKEFFAQLLPAHAACLKAEPEHELTQRLQEHALTKVEQIAIPSREDAANEQQEF